MQPKAAREIDAGYGRDRCRSESVVIRCNSPAGDHDFRGAGVVVDCIRGGDRGFPDVGNEDQSSVESPDGQSSARLQGLPPILPAGQVRALVLGSFPSVKSLESKQYYGNPHNWFWRVLCHCGVIDDPAARYAVRVAALQRAGLALWDLYARVRRPGSGDDRISDAVPNRVGPLLAERGPFPILLNGRRSREWRLHFSSLDAATVELPSTSPRPLHWNTPASRVQALAEWCAALAAAGIPRGRR